MTALPTTKLRSVDAHVETFNKPMFWYRNAFGCGPHAATFKKTNLGTTSCALLAPHAKLVRVAERQTNNNETSWQKH